MGISLITLINLEVFIKVTHILLIFLLFVCIDCYILYLIKLMHVIGSLCVRDMEDLSPPFVDNFLLFAEAAIEQAYCIKHCFHQFCEASVQKINFKMTLIYSSINGDA